MRESGTSTNRPWRRVRRGAALLALAPIVAAVGLSSPALAAKSLTDSSPTTTPAPAAKKATSETTTPTAPAAAAEPAPAEPETKDSGDPAPTETPSKEGDPGTDELTGEPGTCDEKSCKHLTPIVECSFKDPGTGLYNTVWSYRSGGSRDTIPVGWHNYFTPGKIDLGQPTYFEPGLHRNVLITTHDGELTWVLGESKATAPGKDCGHNPVPITGAGLSSIVTLLAVAAGLGIVFVVRGRRARRNRTNQTAPVPGS